MLNLSFISVMHEHMIILDLRIMDGYKICKEKIEINSKEVGTFQYEFSEN